jgi:hypothetical protein
MAIRAQKTGKGDEGKKLKRSNLLLTKIML